MYDEQNDSKFDYLRVTPAGQIMSRPSWVPVTKKLTLIKFTLLSARLREGVGVIFGAADDIEPEWTAISFW